ncbi:hypothetical protein TSUD_14990 [Trifolium subterraneum]|uniref:Exostosin GT47 domain-containing protein n=1 Tax=Trifolium subterraneum TaxID=3900 RepID=A0A2Z6MPR5_TRISU|nr:hypothetical protein TSUD_14990 [Trifolium subterraneum]
MHHHHTLCTRTHQIGALLLVAATFFFTRLLDAPCSISTTAPQRKFLLLPESQEVSIKIYVYDVNEIDGLNQLLKGRDGKIAPEACLKGQWGSQVKIHKLLLESRYRTKKKEEADLFFVPSYVKCARMMGGLNDKEINNTFVKVISQMPYFRLSGGRNHIFVFPSGAGAHLFKSWATYINRSIILTPEGDRTDKRDTSAFNTWKDIIIPGNVEDGMTKTGSPMVQPLPLSKRKYLANYLGRAQGKAGRLQLIELSKQFPEKLECPDLKFSGDKDIEAIIACGRQVRCMWVYASDSESCSAMRGIMWELQRKVRQFHQSAETFWLHNGSFVNRNLVEFSKWKLPVPLP